MPQRLTGAALRDIRKNRLRVQQKDFAAMLGYTPRQIQNWERERGRSGIPLWMNYALAWMLLHGTNDPLETLNHDPK